jgi:integrase
MGVNFTPLLTPLKMKIQIENHEGRLRLRWYDGKKRHTLAIGIADSPIGRSLAQKKKAEIELDWQTGHYDPTVLKYRPRSIGKNASEIFAPELFQKFSDYQLKHTKISEASIESHYQPIVGMLKKHLNQPAHTIGKQQVDKFVTICRETLCGSTAKERCGLLFACWEWAVGKYHLAPDNPWIGAKDRFKVVPKQKVKPFTLEELKAIKQAIANHPQYRHYSDFFSFLINTGCRFGEAAGLRWRSISQDYKTAWIGESISRGRSGTTKTGKSRNIQLSPTLQEILRARSKQFQPMPDDLVFPAPKGGAIDDHRWRARCWKSILSICQIDYRKPYALRHSAISHALAQGVNPIALAEQTGHDKRVLLDTYAHVIAKEYLFIEV